MLDYTAIGMVIWGLVSLLTLLGWTLASLVGWWVLLVPALLVVFHLTGKFVMELVELSERAE